MQQAEQSVDETNHKTDLSGNLCAKQVSFAHRAQRCVLVGLSTSRQPDAGHLFKSSPPPPHQEKNKHKTQNGRFISPLCSFSGSCPNFAQLPLHSIYRYFFFFDILQTLVNLEEHIGRFKWTHQTIFHGHESRILLDLVRFPDRTNAELKSNRSILCDMEGLQRFERRVCIFQAACFQYT